MLTDNSAVCTWHYLDKVGLLTRYEQIVAIGFVKGNLVHCLRRHVRLVTCWHLLMTSFKNTVVNLEYSLCALDVPDDHLIVLLEADHYFGVV